MNLVMRSLADPTRRGLFERVVRHVDITVAELSRNTAVSQPAISQHLRSLKEAGLVTDRRQGRHVHYRAEPKALKPLVDWLGLYGAFWTERVNRLKTLLEESDS